MAIVNTVTMDITKKSTYILTSIKHFVATGIGNTNIVINNNDITTSFTNLLIGNCIIFFNKIKRVNSNNEEIKAYTIYVLYAGNPIFRTTYERGKLRAKTIDTASC